MTKFSKVYFELSRESKASEGADAPASVFEDEEPNPSPELCVSTWFELLAVAEVAEVVGV